MRDFVIVFFLVGYAAIVGRNSISRAKDVIALPPPEQSARTSVEEALARRRSVREYSSKHLTDQQLGQLCWAREVSRILTASAPPHPPVRCTPWKSMLSRPAVSLITPETHSCANPNNYTVKHLEEFRS